MVNSDVGVLPKERRPAARKCPASTEPPIDERRGENGSMRVVVEVHTDVYPCDPAKCTRRGCHEGRSGPWASDASEPRVVIQPEGACECKEASDVEDHAVEVLGMSENAPTAQSRRTITPISAHKNLIAALSARTAITKLTQGPQRTSPTMIEIAKRGQNDLPRTRPAFDKYL